MGQVIYGLVSENGKTLSLARIAFGISFGIACSIGLMIPPIDIPEYLFGFLGILLLYNTFKKGLFYLIPALGSVLSRGRYNPDNTDLSDKRQKRPKKGNISQNDVEGAGHYSTNEYGGSMGSPTRNPNDS